MEIQNEVCGDLMMLKIGEVIFPDAIIQLPIFTASKATGKPERPIEIPEMAGFKNILIDGKRFNVFFHMRAYRYALSKSQRRNSTTVVIDIYDMLREFKIDSNDFSHYLNEYSNLLLDWSETKISFTSPSGVRFHGSLIDTYTDPIDGVVTIRFGEIYSALMKAHNFFSRINYLDDRIKGGVATVLKEMLDIEYRKIKGSKSKTINVKVEYLLASLQLGGSRENNLKTLNVALQYFIDIGFISSIEKVKKGKSVVELAVTFNSKFKMSDLDKVIVESKVAETDTSARPPVDFIEHEFAPLMLEHTPAIQSALADIEEFFKNEELRMSKSYICSTSIDDNFSAFNNVPDFTAWRKESAEREQYCTPIPSPRKVWPDDAQYDCFN